MEIVDNVYIPVHVYHAHSSLYSLSNDGNDHNPDLYAPNVVYTTYYGHHDDCIEACYHTRFLPMAVLLYSQGTILRNDQFFCNESNPNSVYLAA